MELKDREMIRTGLKSGIVIYGSEKVMDHSTMTAPGLQPTGIADVFVNGVAVVKGENRR